MRLSAAPARSAARGFATIGARWSALRSNLSWSPTASRRPSASRRSRSTRSRSARCTRFRRAAHDELRALRDVSFAVARGRVLRHRRAQRLGQVDAAEVPRRASTRADARRDLRRRARCRRSSSSASASTRTSPRATTSLLNATMLGLSPREARGASTRSSTSPSCDEFVDLKLKNYSSGMMVRLAFAVMIQVDADILLIDEVLAVGDAAFQQKCFDEFEAHPQRSGATVLLVTHDMGAVRRFCDRAMLLEHGRVVDDRRSRDGRQPLPGAELLRARRARQAEAHGDAARSRQSPTDGDRPRRRPRRDHRRLVRGRARHALDDAAATASRATFAMRVSLHGDVERPASSRVALRNERAHRALQRLERLARRRSRAVRGRRGGRLPGQLRQPARLPTATT